MLNKKLILSLIAALIAIIVIGFVALHFVPTSDIVDFNITGNDTNVTEDVNVTVPENVTNVTDLNVTNVTDTVVEDAKANATDVNATDVNATASASDDIDAGDVLHKQTFVIYGNETGQYQGMEPGTYVMYYTENDGPIKIEKVA